MGKQFQRWSRAFSRATGVRKYLLLGTPFAIATLYASFRALAEGKDVTLPNLPVWEIAIFATLVLLVVWFFQRILDLEDLIEPALKMDFEQRPPFIVTEPFQAQKPAQRTIRLKVTNTGERSLKSCLVKLEDMRAEGHSINAFTPVGLITQHQSLQKDRPAGPFRLRGGEHKFIILAVLDEAKKNSKIVMGYEHRDYPNHISRGEYELDIRAYGGTGTCAGTYQLSVTDSGKLTLKELPKDGTR